ncbi:MAG: GNAT family N-acetyltransferase [Rikenellaceae bacterium]
MLQRITITDKESQHFAKCWQLYTDAFPLEERRDIDYHLATIDAAGYHFEAILDDGEFIGIICWWHFDGVRFIEHLATSPSVRDRGYGKTILKEFIDQEQTPIILEVEHPTDELSQRRIGFYERIGFTLNDYDYCHPPYHIEQDEFVSLMLMSYPKAIGSSEFEKFKDECYARVHFRRKQ